MGNPEIMFFMATFNEILLYRNICLSGLSVYYTTLKEINKNIQKQTFFSENHPFLVKINCHTLRYIRP